MRVYFFATCMGAGVFADTCLNAMKLLQNAGAEIIYKKDQTCCGQPSFNSGYYDETRKIALYNMSLFEKDYPIVLPSGSCAGMMKHDYIELFADTPDEVRAREFASRIYEVSEFLVGKLQVRYTDTGEHTKITWHSNCHALRVAKCIPHAKTLLRQLKNVELIELEREEECCGFGGTFSIKEPEISNAMVSEKILDIQNQKVEYLIAGDAGCLLNISGAMKKQGVAIKAMHLYDFLTQRIGA
ncbi:(Fe-S)-binding protein [Helicobacter fennelliae]|uniref:Predicted L-lactate dehydrogenase, Fe-S oxidoreductase subunit YkgE n=3 Tax=Helicobacter TaxID=209 RepID=T1CYJ9_9HELI|nr:(Fe-S)-binding protein [Helicobacter fennelliae]GAD18026.1 predicted L-lactate dehydrogenase, Fe-S oxidoreductase subunit YkgE [Helicobacter fennelliae MRY12-0050]SQB98155.1 oxidoreductase iron-sulfur subunit [Helicobacter fennelliae]STP06632.1 oxidoreductase iron-sulfur subunit [Helicobacter fennelliae]STQ83813.1 oxidoreductase iron-sulfur subunit [Helicobacter fennelliae]